MITHLHCDYNGNLEADEVLIGCILGFPQHAAAHLIDQREWVGIRAIKIKLA